MSGTLVAAPRAVFSVLDGSCRDRAVADDVVAGRFAITGVTLRLGTPPDWTRDPYPADKEWRIEWVKFYYGLDLAHAYAATRAPRYAAAWAGLVTSYVAQVPAAADDTEVMARRIQNWIYAWNRFQLEGGHAGLSDADAPAVAEYLWAEVQHVRAHLTAERNHRTLELYALLVAALAFPQFDDGHTLRDFAFHELHENLLADVRPDGVHREGSTHYHCIVLRSFLGAMCLAEREGVTLPPAYRERVTAAVEFALHCHRPDGAIPACADSDSESYRDVLALAATLLGRPDLAWGASVGAAGTPPARRFASFPDGGYFVQRSGWGETRPCAEEAFLIFDCGPIGDGGHGHYDALAVEIAAGGRPLLVDPGRYTYAEGEPNWRRWFKGTAAHNTVLVDGQDQTPYRRRKPKGPVAHATLLARATAPVLDLLAGTVTSPCYDAVHTRTVLFVAGEYWIVVDDLVAATLHDYEVRWHLAPAAGARVTLPADGPQRAESDGVTLTFGSSGTLRVEDGWYAPRYGVKTPAPVVVQGVRASTTRIVTVIDPATAAGPRRHVDVRTMTGGPGAAVTHIDLHHDGAAAGTVDTVAWAIDPQPIGVGPFSGTARAVWTRVDGAGHLVAAAAADVREGRFVVPGAESTTLHGGAGVWLTWTAGQAAPTVARTAP